MIHKGLQFGNKRILGNHQGHSSRKALKWLREGSHVSGNVPIPANFEPEVGVPMSEPLSDWFEWKSRDLPDRKKNEPKNHALSQMLFHVWLEMSMYWNQNIY